MTSGERNPPEIACDVLVCGGGPAGFGAALAAARAGAQTVLIERLGQVGGMHTGAGVLNWCDTPGGPIFEEFLARMEENGAAHYRFNPEIFVRPGRAQMDTELSKAVMMQMLVEAGVEPLLLTQTGRALTGDGILRGVEVVNKSGRQMVRARVVIDTTADADVAAEAGVPCGWGAAEDGRIQHCNFRVWYDGLERARWEAEKPDEATIIALLERAQAEGEITPPDGIFQPQARHFPYNMRTGTLDLSGWELEDIDPTNAWQVSRALAQCQRAVAQLIPFCRRHFPGHEKMGLRKLPSMLGTRESRRIEGLYTLTKEDVVAGRKFPDGITRACFYMDQHDSPPGITLPHPPEHVWARRPAAGDYYEIPYRCLLPQGVDHLLVAGRSLSADREAQGSVRAMPTCLWTGQAAGLAGAEASRRNISVREIEGSSLRKALHLDES